MSAPAASNPSAAFSGVIPIIVKYPLGPLSNVIVAATMSLVFSFAALMAIEASSIAVIVSTTTPFAPPLSNATT